MKKCRAVSPEGVRCLRSKNHDCDHLGLKPKVGRPVPVKWAKKKVNRI